MINNNKEIKEQILCITLCTLVSFLPIMSFINDVCNVFIGSGFIYDTMVCYTTLWFLIGISLIIVVRHIKIDVILFLLFLYTAWKITFSLCIKNTLYMINITEDFTADPFYTIFLYSFTGYVFSRYITDYKLLENIFCQFALTVIICSTISFFLTMSKNYQKQYMVFSYNMLIHIVFLIIYHIEHKKPVYLAVGIVGFLMMFLAGCRGALISSIASLIVYFMFRKIEFQKKIGIICLMAILIVLFIWKFDTILSWLANVAEFFNIDSRTIQKIESGEFFDESGRDIIQDRIVSKINFFGHGLFGDRVLGGGSYAHNFVIEILAQFGLVLGLPILIVVALLLVRGLSAHNHDLRNLIIIFLSAGLFKLFFSSSYLNQEPCFYVLLGLCVNSFKRVTNANEKPRETL